MKRSPFLFASLFSITQRLILFCRPHDSGAPMHPLFTVNLCFRFFFLAHEIRGCCAMTYLFCGILCFDRFTALAFISTKDPRITTAVPATKQSTSSIGEGTPSQMMKAQTEFETDPEDYQPPPSEDLARRNDTPGYRSDPPAWH